MGLREDLQRRIDRKVEEIKELQLQVREAQAYLQGLQDTLKMIPKLVGPNHAAVTLRPGSDLAKAYDAIKKAGVPLHISALLKQLGKPLNRASRAGLSGNLASYVRNGDIFSRPAPNTFFLLELESSEPQAAHQAGPPEDFGRIPPGAEEDEPAVPSRSDDDVPF